VGQVVALAVLERLVFWGAWAAALLANDLIRYQGLPLLIPRHPLQSAD
jgi:hypothetical protein